MIATTLLLLSLLVLGVAIVPIDPDIPLHPIDPLPPFRPPCIPSCLPDPCPKGYHCELRQLTVCIKAPCNFPKNLICVLNKVPIG